MARVLIVEDEAATALSIQNLLETHGHTIVAIATSGQQAIEALLETQPDLVLMDIHLEGTLDGITTATEIRKRFEIPLIFLTAQTEVQLLQQAIATEPFGYLMKPFEAIELFTSVDIALSRHRLEKRLSTTLMSIGDGAIATDLEGRITFMNPVAESLTGWKRSAAIGAWVHNILDLIHAETRETIENPLIQAIREGKQIHLSDHCLLRTRHGVERAIGDSATPIRDDNGEIIGGVLIFRDMTERKQAEELFQRRAQEFKALVENSPDAIARFNGNLQYVYVNPTMEQVTGIPSQTFLGRTNQDLGLPESVSAPWNHALQQAWLSGQEISVEFELSMLQKRRFYQVQIVPEFSAKGEVVALLSVARDITGYKQAEVNLRQQAEREKLLSTVTQRIHRSLELSEILETTVTEVRQLLQTDRVIVYRFEPDWSGDVVTESVGTGWTQMQGRRIFDPCLAQETCILPYLDGHVSRVEDLQTSGLAECYVELLKQYEVRANLVIPVLLSPRLWGLLAIQTCAAPRHWQEQEIDLLKQISAQLSIALQQSELYERMQRQAQREQSLNRVIQETRNSLDLNTVFDTAAYEVRHLLQVEQVNIVQYLPDRGVWVHAASYSHNPAVLPLSEGLEIPDYNNSIAEKIKQRQIVRIDNTDHLEDQVNQILAQTFPGAWLCVPLLVGNAVWGSLGLVKSPHPFVWEDWQVELLCAVADQLAIAIQQSELYQQVQQLNANLEHQVHERTQELQRAYHFEATLKRITDRVRDSLDEDQILQILVEELALAIGVSTCSVALYHLENQTATIHYEYTTAISSFQGRSIVMEQLPRTYQQLLQGQHFQFCNYTTTGEENLCAKLACPIVDDQDVLGDLWLTHDADRIFSEQEIRLVQQVANQCAIALRQSQLYQAAQTQVEELERLNRLKDDFLSTVSHELRTPMSNIKMAIQMLEIALKPLGVNDQGSTINRYFRVLQAECDREIDLINDLLNLSRLESGTEPLMLTTLDLRSWILDVVEPFAASIHSQQQTLDIHLPENLPTLTTDFSHLERILSELLNNAHKYTPPLETIAVSAQTTTDGVLLQVSNSGVEIPIREMERIFEKFYRIPNHDRWQYSGTGLGLALVKKLVEHLHGTIEVSSRSGWTTFVVQIPDCIEKTHP